MKKIEIAKRVKWECFGQYAREASQFYDGPHDFMWREEYSTGTNGFLEKDGSQHLPTFRITVNKAFETVALFGPALMHKYPEVTVTSNSPPVMSPEVLGTMPDDPAYMQYLMTEQFERSTRNSCASLKQHYLNWLQIEGDKKSHARRAITEAIVKGMGILWTELYAPPGSEIRYPRSRFVSVDDLIQDPDATYAEDVQWIARRHVEPVNLVARKFGLNAEDLKGHFQSYGSQATGEGEKQAKRRKNLENNTTYDLIEYWDIYSKNGFGHRMRRTKSGRNVGVDLDERINLDPLGDYTRIVVSKGIPFPLNFPTEALSEPFEQQFERAQWPIPFWTDQGTGNGWPFSALHFYDKMNNVWPLGIIKAAIGELRFVNWCLSFLADKAAASSTTYVGVIKQAGSEIQQQLKQGLAPFSIIEVADIHGKSMKDVVSFLESPSFSIDVWRMVSEVMDLIDKRTGLTELIYGLTGKQIRSATEADIRDSNVSIRPDDMAERTEDFYSMTCMKEMEAVAWALEPTDYQPIMGAAGASVFERVIQGGLFENVVRDYNYRIAAGSARKPNKNNRLRSLTEWGRSALPVVQQFAMEGNPGPWNAYMQEVAKAMDFDAEPFLIPPPQPQEQVDPEEEEHVADLERDDEKHDQDMRHDEEKHRLSMMMLREQGQAKARAASSNGNGR